LSGSGVVQVFPYVFLFFLGGGAGLGLFFWSSFGLEVFSGFFFVAFATE
jgi:hypothetical protein